VIAASEAGVTAGQTNERGGGPHRKSRRPVGLMTRARYNVCRKLTMSVFCDEVSALNAFAAAVP
jgi:hypothetical protein